MPYGDPKPSNYDQLYTWYGIQPQPQYFPNAEQERKNKEDYDKNRDKLWQPPREVKADLGVQPRHAQTEATMDRQRKTFWLENETGGKTRVEINDDGFLVVPSVLNDAAKAQSELKTSLTGKDTQGKSFTFTETLTQMVEEMKEKSKIQEDAKLNLKQDSISRDDQVAMYEHAVAQGFWDLEGVDSDEGWKTVYATKLMLIVSEAVEAMEEIRKPKNDMEIDFEAFGEELADIVIRVLDLGEDAAVDVIGKVKAKHQKNLGRGYRHGGKAF